MQQSTRQQAEIPDPVYKNRYVIPGIILLGAFTAGGMAEVQT